MNRLLGILLETTGLAVLIASTDLNHFSYCHYIVLAIGLMMFGLGRKFSDAALKERILKTIRKEE